MGRLRANWRQAWPLGAAVRRLSSLSQVACTGVPGWAPLSAPVRARLPDTPESVCCRSRLSCSRRLCTQGVLHLGVPLMLPPRSPPRGDCPPPVACPASHRLPVGSYAGSAIASPELSPGQLPAGAVLWCFFLACCR